MVLIKSDCVQIGNRRVLCFHVGRGHRKSCKGCLMLHMETKTTLIGKWVQHFSRLFSLLDLNHWRMWRASRNLKKMWRAKAYFWVKLLQFAESKAAVPEAVPRGRESSLPAFTLLSLTLSWHWCMLQSSARQVSSLGWKKNLVKEVDIPDI